MNTSKTLKMTVYASLFSALIASGAYISIPIGPVPIVLQNMFVLMAGVLLGTRWGSAAVLLYLFMGACGFPVFAGGTGGIGRLFGPTGGYLLSYIPAVLITAFIAEKGGAKLWVNVLAMAAGSLVVYAVGVPWLKLVTGMTWTKAVSVGMVPFIVGDAVKIFAGSYIAKLMYSMIYDNYRQTATT